MKILMGVPAPGLKGGPPTHLPFLVEYFEKRNDFTIKTFYYGSQNFGLHENNFTKILNTSKALFVFIKLIITFKPDIIHLNSAFDKRSIFRDVPFSVVSKLLGKPVLFKVHGSHYDLLYTKNPVFKILIKLFFWGSSNVGVLSEFEKKEFIEQFENSSKLLVVKNIVTAGQQFAEKSSLSIIKKFDALFVSRIEEGKGLEDLLLSVPYVLKSIPNFLLGIAGSGKNLDKCMSLADNLNIQRHIKWLGYVKNENLTEVFSRSRIFVFTSHFPEGMPMSLIEAMTNGIPVITTKTRFAVSYLNEEENVLFIDQNNPVELAKKIVHLLFNELIQEKMRINNLEFLKQFTQDKVGNEFYQIYNKMKK